MPNTKLSKKLKKMKLDNLREHLTDYINSKEFSDLCKSVKKDKEESLKRKKVDWDRINRIRIIK